MQSNLRCTQHSPVFTYHAICSLQTISYLGHFYAVPAPHENIALHSSPSVHRGSHLSARHHTLLNTDHNAASDSAYIL